MELTKEPQWFDSLLYKNAAAAHFTVYFSLKSRSLHDRVDESMLIFYVQVVNTLLETYATDDTIAKADTEILSFNQPTNKSPLKYVNAQWMNTLHFPQLYDGYLLNEKLLEGLLPTIGHLMQSF